MRSCLLAILLCENPIDYAWTGALPAIELVVPSMVPCCTRLCLPSDGPYPESHTAGGGGERRGRPSLGDEAIASNFGIADRKSSC